MSHIKTLCGLAGLALSVLFAPIDPAAAAAAAATTPAEVEAPASNSAELITLNFPGGTLTEFAQALEKARGRPVNLILPDQAELIAVPSVRVTNTDLRYVFAGMSQGSGIEFKEIGDGNSATAVWIVRSSVRVQHQRQMVRSFSAEKLLTKYNINDITTAVKTAWAMAGESRDGAVGPELKFHQETKLLIVCGTDAQVNLAWDVFSQLSANLPPPVTEGIAVLETRRKAAEAELQELLTKYTTEHPRVKEATARLQQIEKQLNQTKSEAGR